MYKRWPIFFCQGQVFYCVNNDVSKLSQTCVPLRLRLRNKGNPGSGPCLLNNRRVGFIHQQTPAMQHNAPTRTRGEGTGGGEQRRGEKRRQEKELSVKVEWICGRYWERQEKHYVLKEANSLVDTGPVQIRPRNLPTEKTWWLLMSMEHHLAPSPGTKIRKRLKTAAVRAQRPGYDK